MQSKQMQRGSKEDRLAEELAHRGTTDKTTLRKTQIQVTQSLNSNSNNNKNETAAEHKSETAGNFEDDDNFFMPKKQILRSDGASLHDVYLSKKGDTWGRILKAQILEEEQNKVVERRRKEQADADYGRLLRQQVNDNDMLKKNTKDSDTLFAQLEDATSKRSDEMQRKRTEDAINRHKQFVQNAIEDVALKQAMRQAQLKEELRASAIMINNAKRLLAEEEEKKNRDRDLMRKYQATIYEENLRNTERKAQIKLLTQAEDRRIIAEQERQFQREQSRRQQELEQRVKQSSDGPAHHVVAKILELKEQEERQFFGTLLGSENSLNKQLKTSEDLARNRANANGQSLTEEWILNSTLNAQKKKEDEDRNTRILQTMQQLLQDQEKQENERREKQRLAQLEYQRALDMQVKELRQRSFDSLQKTMSEQEIKYNADLIKKTAVVL